MLAEEFPGLDRNRVTIDMLCEAVKKSKSTCSHTYFENSAPTHTVNFLPTSLDVDMFAGKRVLLPMVKFTVDSLKDNQAGNGGVYGISHIHTDYSEQEIDNDPVIKELIKVDEGFARLLSPDDVRQMIGSQKMLERVSKGKLSMGMGLMGVTALDPINKEITGSSYFNVLTFSAPEYAQELRALEDLSLAAHGSTNIGAIKEFYSFIAQHSPPELPDYVVSIKEGGISK